MGTVTKEPCEGCGKMVSDDYNDQTGIAIEIAPEEEVVVCCTLDADPKTNCAERARKKRKLCPGCGEHRYNYYLGYLCDACEKDIIAGREIREADPLCKISIGGWELVGSNFRGGGSHKRIDEKERSEFANTLAIAVTGRSAECRTGSTTAYTYVTPTQTEAIGKLKRLFREALDAAKREGARQGRSLLRALADGSATIHDFADRSAQFEEVDDED